MGLLTSFQEDLELFGGVDQRVIYELWPINSQTGDTGCGRGFRRLVLFAHQNPLKGHCVELFLFL